MKKYDVYFLSEEKGEKDRETIKAESHEEAFKTYLVGKTANNFEVVVVEVAGFFDSLTSSTQSFKNPLYKIDEIVGNRDYEKPVSDSEDNISNSFSATSSVTKAHSEKLDKLIELQEKQLYWIRIIGIPFLFAAIGTFLALIIRAFN